jgi:hypothetical protein
MASLSFLKEPTSFTNVTITTVRRMVVRWDDAALGIDWGNLNPELSQSDRVGRSLANLIPYLPKFAPSQRLLLQVT